MCLIVVASGVDARWPVVVVANRDEWHARPAEPVAWRDGGAWVGGRDAQAGGTWLAVRRDGAFAAVTNVREPATSAGARSRGQIPGAVLAAPTLEDGVREVWGTSAEFAGFHVLAGDEGGVWHASNRGVAPRRRASSVWAVSNAVGDAVWPKMARASDELGALLASGADDEALCSWMADTTVTADEHLPETGVPLAWERALSARFVRLPGYGTRATTVLRLGPGDVRVVERSYGPDGATSTVTQAWRR